MLGFTNIEVEILDDLITGWLTNDGEVEKVSINGATSFFGSSRYPNDAKIVITYHTFPSNPSIVSTVSTVSTEVNPNELIINRSSIDIVGDNYQTVISELETTGFTNITTEVLDDLIFGWLTEDGEIEQIEINGKTVFDASDSFLKDAKIVITYHTFPELEISNTDSADESIYVSTEVSSDSVEVSNIESSAESNQEIITVTNNQDFADLLAEMIESDPIFSEFAEKYAGRVIEFDGNIAHMMKHGNFQTRYDILIYAGDYSETSFFGGPSFKFEDVNVFDLHLTGSNIPEYISTGQNFHFVAKVDYYNETTQLFFITPISTEMR